MKQKRIGKKAVSWLLTLVMLMGLLPMPTALAADTTTVTEGNTYYFDLSSVTIPGTKNSNLPDTSLHYVPFTYVGNVNAYVLKAASSGVVGSSGAAAGTTDPNATYGYAYDHSLFVADDCLTHSAHWHTLNGASLIFGKSYTGGGITYRLRSMSAGSGSGTNGGAPANNEYDTILDKNVEFIKNWTKIHPLGQDTTTSHYRVSRAIHSIRYWGNTRVSTPYSGVGFRPVLELPSTDTLPSDELKAVTLQLNGGKLGTSDGNIQIVVKTGETFKAPPAQGLTSPSGETISNLKWLSNEGNLYTPNEDVPATVTTLTAIFHYELTYHENTTDTVTGMPDPATQSVAVGSSVTMPAGLTRTGYNFLGWSKSSTDTAASYQPGNAYDLGGVSGGTVDLYAIWKPIEYTVRFQKNPPDGIEESEITGDQNDMTFRYGTEQALPGSVFTLPGYKLLGWAETSTAAAPDYTLGGNVKNLTTTDGDTVSLYAVWKPYTFTVEFNSNGGTGNMDPQTFTYGEAQPLRENTFTYEHKVFGGWNEDENGLGRSYADGADGSRIITPTSDGESVTLYAQWNAIQYWTVTFHPNGGTFNGTNGESEYKTTAADLNNENYVQYPGSDKYSALATPPTRTGYTFAGWYDKLTGGKQIYDKTCALAVSGKDLILTSDTTLYARWTADNMSIDPIADQTYDGTDKKPGLTVKVGGATLAADKYAAVWENNTNATETASNPNKAKVTVYGLKEYAGMEQTAEFSIKQADQALTFEPNDTGNATTTYGETFLNTAIAKYDPNAVSITYSLVGDDDATEAEIDENTGEITPLKGGVTVTVRASAAAATTDNVKAGSKEYILTINKATPVLTFENDTIYGVRTGETKTNELIVTAKDDADAAELKTHVTYAIESQTPTGVVASVRGDNTGTASVTAGSQLGSAVIKATLPETDRYLEAEKTFNFQVASENTIQYTATGYVGVYDGQPHTITVTPTNPADNTATVYYSTQNLGVSDSGWSTTHPTITNVADSKEVYYKIEAAGYQTVKGSARVEITPAKLTSATVAQDSIYTGEAIRAAVSDVKAEGNLNVPESGYETNYYSNINATTDNNLAMVSIIGKDNYTGTLVMEYPIARKSLTDLSIHVDDIADEKYTGSAITPSVTVTDTSTNTVLKEGKDYTLDYEDNVDVGVQTAKVKITGQGNYTDMVPKNFTITNSGTFRVVVIDGSLVYNENEQSPTVLVYDANNKLLTEGTDYRLSGNKETDAGTYKLTVTGLNNYVQNGTEYSPSEHSWSIAKADKTVTAVDVTKFYGDPAFQHTVTLTPDDSAKLTYQSSDPNVVTVGSGCTITIHSAGLATVTIYADATKNYNAAEGRFTVTVKPKATVTVELVLDGETTPFQSYTVTGEYGVELTVEPPAVTGYTYAGTDTDTRTITPTESGPNKITLTYELDSKDVTVRFVNGEGAEIAPAQTFTVKRGDDLTVYAPAVSGYQLAAGQDASQTLTSAEIFDQSKTALTFRYARVVDEGFVKHTVIVTTDRDDPGKTLFQYTALVEKGDGSDVTYTAPTMPGYAVQGAQTQTLRNNENGTIYFVYGEDAVSIVIKMVMQGAAEPFARQTLTGYRAGQTVEVVAPAQDGKILVGALTKTVSDLTAGENVVTFEYTDPGNITLTLIEKDSGETIRVLSPGTETTYTAGQGDLDLSGYGYLFTPDGSTAPFNAADGSLAVTSDMLAGAATDYQIYYTKETRGVTYVALDKDKLGDTAPEDATGDMVIQTIENADTARVGESFKAVAPRIPGYTVAGDLTQVISKVEKGDGSPIKVYFLYTEKAIGTVTVRFLKPDGATVLSAYEASSAVGEEFTATAPETLEGGKYKLPDGADRTKAVRITGTDDTIDFVYEANFHTVTVKTQRGDAAAAEFETVEVVSGQNAVLNPPSMGGYVLRGITVGAEGSATTFPAGWDGTANALTLSAVDVDVAVTYHYLAMEENQVMLTVIDKYELYELGRRTVVVTKGQDSEVAVAEYTGYKVTSVSYGGTERELTDGPLTARFGADTEVTFRFVREDGSTAVPGGDGKIGTEDDVIVKPGTDGDPLTTDPDTGNVRLPDGGTVVYPGAPGGNGSTITVPEGTVVDSSGTIHLPEDKDGKVEPDGPVIPGGSTVGPDGTINYKYTLRHVDNQGGEKLPAGSVLVKAGAEQTVTAPAVNGYTVDKERQTITGGTGPFTITFTYTKSSSSGGSSSSATHPPAVADPDQCSGGSSCPIWPFTDASSTAWYHDGVHFCLENGLMIGKSSTVFDPNGTITRGQIVTILWRLEGQPRAGAARYSDVIAGQYYTEAVVWAAENGIVTGYPDGTFHPNASITREQLAAILWRYAKYKGVSMSDQADLSRFTDRDEIAPYAAQAMAWANANGLINGMTATALVPRGDASRAQAASILQRFCENILKG